VTDETANPILEYMRRFERSLGDMRAGLHDMREELQGVNRRLEGVTRIEKRLDLVEG
jgi:hypothetical protein